MQKEKQKKKRTKKDAEWWKAKRLKKGGKKKPPYNVAVKNLLKYKSRFCLSSKRLPRWESRRDVLLLHLSPLP